MLHTCSSCGKDAEFTEEENNEEGRMCKDCITHFIKDPVTPEEKKVLKEPLHVAQMRKIIKEGCAGVTCPFFKKRTMVDSMSAHAFIAVYDAIKEEHKVHFSKLSLNKAMSVVWKLVKI